MIFVYLAFYAAILILEANYLGIGAQEAKILFEGRGWLHEVVGFFYTLWPNELGVRTPVITVSLLNVVLFYFLAKIYLKRKTDVWLATVVFSLLPAVLGASIVINKASFIIFATLLFLLLFKKSEKAANLLLLLYLFWDKAFAILFLAIFFWALYEKRKTALYYLFLFLLSWWIYGLQMGGKPQNHFLETFALFSAIFSPLVFLYFVYALYRTAIKGEKDILWFVSAVSFLFALLLSFRQHIHLVDFAPFVVVGVILMVKSFFQTYRVRLPKYRKKLLVAFWIVLASLILSDLMLIFNPLLFRFIPPKHHFAYKNFLAKSLAKTLEKLSIDCIHTPHKSLSLQLRFYKIKNCKKRELFFHPLTNTKPLTLHFPGGIPVLVYVTECNKQAGL